MIRRIILPTILAILAYGFWASPDFKEIAAGVAIFLFGMLAMEEGFRAFTGGALETILKRTTNRLWKSLAFGTVTTTIMQSSSLVSVITISFLSAGLISLTAGIGIIFGANLGTTTGAWLVAGLGLKVKLSAYAMPMLVFGVILIFQRAKSLKGIGYVLAGVGFLFLGIHHMKEGFEAFKEGIDLSQYAMAGYSGLFLFVLVGIAATVVMQSSHATLVLVITALAAGQVTYENALALAIGSNIGTTITAILGSLSANIQGKRLAAAHLLFNVSTGLIAIVGIHQIIAVVDVLSDRFGIASENYTLRLAVFHTVFNLVGIVVMTPFIGKMAAKLETLFKEPVVVFEKPKYLNDAAMDFGDAAIEAARKETIRLYDKALELIVHGVGMRRRDVFGDTPPDQFDSLVNNGGGQFEEKLQERYEQGIKAIYGATLEFISRAQEGMGRTSAEQLFAIRTAGRLVVEAIKGVSHLQKNMKRYIGSDNLEMNAAYEEIRTRLTHVLRAVDSVRRSDEDGLAILSLNETRVTAKQEDILANGKLDELVRGNRISAAEATSLINDNGYVYGVCKNLIVLGQILFSEHNQAEREAEFSLRLDDAEIDTVQESITETQTQTKG